MNINPTINVISDVPFRMADIKNHIKDMDDEFGAINSFEDRNE